VKNEALKQDRKQVIIPIILAGIIIASVVASLGLYSIQSQQYSEIVKQSAAQLKQETAGKSFHVNQLASQHISGIRNVLQIMTQAQSFQSGEYDRIKLLLDAAKAESSDIVDFFFILDNSGVLRYATTSDPEAVRLIGTSLSDHLVYTETRGSLNAFISPLTPGFTDSSYRFYIVVPIVDPETGQFKGTVAASILADTFAKSIEKIIVATPGDVESRSLSLIDPEGKIMYSGASTTNLGKDVLSEEVIGSIPSGIKESLVNSLQEALSGKSGIYEINLADHPELNSNNAEVPANPFDYVLFSYAPVVVDDRMVMVSFLTKSANLQDIVQQGTIFGQSYMFVFIYLMLGTMTVFAVGIIVINRKLSRTIMANNKDLQQTNSELLAMAAEITERDQRLKEVDIEKEEFSAMITHELKTPLVPVIGYSELLLDGTLGDLNEKQKETIHVVYTSAVSLSRLISDLLDVRKLELGKMKFEMKSVSAKDLVELCIKVMTPLAQAKNVNLISRTSADGLKVECDPKRISQVLGNLVNNAIKFVDPNEGKIELSVDNKDNGEEIVFSIKDNGVGIPKEKQANMFKKFYQADTSMTRNAGGTGLGLAICKAIVDAHEGEIWFVSEPGEGTIFHFSLPKSLESPTIITPKEMNSRENLE
jgi:signal transduction histidine kinase